MLLSEMTGEMLEQIANLTEARICNVEKDTLRMSEVQLLWSDELEKEVLGYWTTLNKYWAEKKLPKCTCADQENGFMGLEKWNPYFYNGRPCSLEYYKEWKTNKKEGVKV